MSRTTIVALALAACHPGAPVQPPHGVDRERAVAIAIDTGRAEGYDPALYDLQGVAFSTEPGSFHHMWRVSFELKPPGRPGGFFTVYVAPDGTPRLFHGK